MSETLLAFIIIVSLLVCSFMLFLLLKKRNEIKERTPAALANQVLRHPERILIDVPLYTPTTPGISGYDFLLKTEAVLASIGELQSRRQFLNYFAEVVKSPSKDNLGKLTHFLFQNAPASFKDALRWDGKCDDAIQFLEFVHRLIEFVEKGKNLKSFQKDRKKRGGRPSRKNRSKVLQGVDAEIMQEWNDLNNAFHRTIATINKNKYDKIGDRNENLRFGSLTLIEEDKVPHLIPFLIATRDVCNNILMVRATK